MTKFQCCSGLEKEIGKLAKAHLYVLTDVVGKGNVLALFRTLKGDGQ